jgi:hypothetical protein
VAHIVVACRSPSHGQTHLTVAAGSPHTARVPEHWTIPRIAGLLYRTLLEPLGFERYGNTCTRRDSLLRTIRFYGLRASRPEVQIVLTVGVPELPAPIVPFRRDTLWAPLEPATGPNRYLRPRSAEPLPQALVADVSGPGVEFLLRARDLLDFAAWAEEIYEGDVHRGWWGRFRPVMPQGTAPLQAATFAAAVAGETASCSRFAGRVLALERDQRERDDFLREVSRVAPTSTARVLNSETT